MEPALTLSLGILFIAGLAAALVASRLGIPRVTFYIVIGLLVGPSLFDLIPERHLEELDPVLKLALAMVLLEIGSRFTLDSFRRVIRTALPLALGELGCTFLLVVAGVWIAGEEAKAAVLLGALALATAPATTIVVLQDCDSEGPITSLTYVLVAMNNLAAILAFELLFVLASLSTNPAGGLAFELGRLAVDLVGSTATGLIGGLVVSVLAARLSDRQRSLAVFAVTTLVLGICEGFRIPYLLTFLTMGVTLANTSSLARPLLKSLDPVTGLLYVVFFVAAGAELNLRSLKAAGVVGIVYIVARCAGKYLGIRGAARIRGESPAVQRWLGLTLIAQAGAAIGLVQIVVERDRELGAHLQSVIVGTVIFFEVLGPILARTAVVRAGEVPIAQLVRPDRPGWLEIGWSVLGRIRQAFGGDPWAGRSIETLTVRDLMRQNVPALRPSDGFLTVLDFIEHSRQHVYPVVGEAGELAGVIYYHEIRSELFDPELAALVRAEDLCRPARWTLFSGQLLDEALAVVEKTSDDAIPVVAGEDDLTLVGIIERRDIVRFVKRRHLPPG